MRPRAGRRRGRLRTARGSCLKSKVSNSGRQNLVRYGTEGSWDVRIRYGGPKIVLDFHLGGWLNYCLSGIKLRELTAVASN